MLLQGHLHRCCRVHIGKEQLLHLPCLAAVPGSRKGRPRLLPSKLQRVIREPAERDQRPGKRSLSKRGQKAQERNSQEARKKSQDRLTGPSMALEYPAAQRGSLRNGVSLLLSSSEKTSKFRPQGVDTKELRAKILGRHSRGSTAKAKDETRKASERASARRSLKIRMTLSCKII